MEQQPTGNDFLQQATQVIQEHLSDESFGVTEMAEQMGMSRSNLLRKIKKETQLSVSQFIRKLRLEQAKELLGKGKLNVSEVSFEVGFGSPSYFIKCFHEQYGFPPGELGRQGLQEVVDETRIGEQTPEGEGNADNGRKTKKFVIAIIVLLATVGLATVFWPTTEKERPEGKSIAVLPFINDSNDSTNVYIINGLMESLLNNLQKIKKLHVISRTSVEKYRHAEKSIPEIADELGVQYFVEGSGQKIGNRILLNIQLIEAQNDKHLWAKQYRRELDDIFGLQLEIAENITNEIKVIITPQEQSRIAKTPTHDVEAYDHYLKGTELMRWGNREGLPEAIKWFEKAIARDSSFANAYAETAISYYYLDMYKAEKKHWKQVADFADKALFYDPQLSRALVAKALSYIIVGENQKAVPYLEKALEYSPNSVWIINMLSDFYTNYLPNSSKYLEYALKGVRLDIGAHDSISASYVYLHVSNALIQSGFVKEAREYVDRSLAYDKSNLFSEYLKAYILFIDHGDLKRVRTDLKRAWRKDTTRLDILQEIAKTYYEERDYETAYIYYKKFTDQRTVRKLDIYQGEDSKIAWVCSKLGKKEQAAQYLEQYRVHAENYQTIYQQLSLAAYNAMINNIDKAMKHLKQFVAQDEYHYWIVLFLKNDPIFENCRQHPDFEPTMKLLEDQFRVRQQKVRETLEAEGLL